MHGNYCGYGNRGGRPVDALDDACRKHDNCWGGIGIVPGQLSCVCDRTLAVAAGTIAGMPTESPQVREKAALISTFFAHTPCW